MPFNLHFVCIIITSFYLIITPSPLVINPLSILLLLLFYLISPSPHPHHLSSLASLSILSLFPYIFLSPPSPQLSFTLNLNYFINIPFIITPFITPLPPQPHLPFFPTKITPITHTQTHPLIILRHSVIVIYNCNRLQCITVFQVIVIVMDYPLIFF